MSYVRQHNVFSRVCLALDGHDEESWEWLCSGEYDPFRRMAVEFEGYLRAMSAPLDAATSGFSLYWWGDPDTKPGWLDCLQTD